MITKEEVLPFGFTPQVYRYLEGLIEISEKTFAHKTGDEVFIETYLPGESKTPESQTNFGNFWGYLEKIGAVKISEKMRFEEGGTVEGDIVEEAGTRTFYFSKTYVSILDVDKVKKLLQNRDAKPVIKLQTLELIAKEIAQYRSGYDLIKFLKEHGVTSNLIVYPETKWRMLYKVFRVLSTSSNKKANTILYRIIESTIHPLFSGGSEEASLELTKKYNSWLKYDHITIEDYKLWFEPTDEQWEYGIHEPIDSYGNRSEAKVYTIMSDQLAEVWVLWNQVMLLLHAYRSYPTLNQEKLEKLYLEIIGRVEHLIKKGQVGKLREEYKRPFMSLLTSEIEATAKGVKSPFELTTKILLEITEMKPFPSEVAKKMEENSGLIEEVRNATKITTQKKPEEDHALVTLQLKTGTLSLNKDTGQIRLNEVGATLNPKGKEFEILLKLATNKNYMATYGQLNATTKDSKRGLTFSIRNLKTSLGILPAKKAKNEDIIDNIKNLGYKLVS